MIGSPEKYDFSKVVEILREGGTILYPTDTIWGIGCDATNPRAVEKIYKIKERMSQKSLIILVENVEMLSRYVEDVPELALDLITSVSDPLTVIYPKARKLAKNVTGEDGTIAIRIPNEPFCQELIRSFGKPITSTSANVSGAPNPLSYRQISADIKNAVDYVVKVNQHTINRPKPSTIVRINNAGEIQILRN